MTLQRLNGLPFHGLGCWRRCHQSLDAELVHEAPAVVRGVGEDEDARSVAQQEYQGKYRMIGGKVTTTIPAKITVRAVKTARVVSARFS